MTNQTSMKHLTNLTAWGGIRVQVMEERWTHFRYYQYALYSGTHKMMISDLRSDDKEDVTKKAKRFAESIGAKFTKKIGKVLK